MSVSTSGALSKLTQFGSAVTTSRSIAGELRVDHTSLNAPEDTKMNMSHKVRTLEQRSQTQVIPSQDGERTSMLERFAYQISVDFQDPSSTNEEDILNKHELEQFEFRPSESVDPEESEESDDSDRSVDELADVPLYRRICCFTCGPKRLLREVERETGIK